MNSPAPASLSTPASKAKKAAAVRAVTNFSSLSDSDLFTLATAVIKGMTGNAAFPSPPVDLTVFGNSVMSFSAATAAALDGGKNAKAVRDAERRVVTPGLKALAHYVETNCNEDPAMLTSSGFAVLSRVKTAGQPVPAPSIRTLDHGANSGQLTVTLKRVPGAKVYFVRYGAMTGGAPGSWTNVAIPNVNVRTTFSGLTSGTTYAFQTQSLGSLGYSDWSDSTTIMCV